MNEGACDPGALPPPCFFLREARSNASCRSFSRLSRNMPLFGISKEAAVGTAVLGVVAAAGFFAGVFTGYNTLNMALVIPDDGKVVACDVNEESANLGKPVWKEAGVEHKIDLRIKPASQTLDELLSNGEAGTFDFAFIDADKEGYNDYYEKCLQLIRKGGIIAIDNVLLSGKVLNPERYGGEVQSMHELNKKIFRDPRVTISMILMGDGVTLAFKL
uniref:Catechol-O-methyltransferase domain containing 1 n=1 Tax=Anolis carolinensis TaxID=28377 RepID=A0A803SZR5_ANOCA